MTPRPMYPTDAFLRNWLKRLLWIFTATLWLLAFGAVGARLAHGQVPDSSLTRLWRDSDNLGQEVVACLSDSVVGPTMTDTTATAGSIPAERSLEVCVPPRWTGTVHTHLPGCIKTPMGSCIGHSLFASPGPSDKAVGREWEYRHGQPGRFCILHLVKPADPLVLGLTCWRSNDP